MPVSEKQKGYAKKHISKLDEIKIRPTKEHGAKIRTAAAVSGLSLQQYILNAVDKEIARENAEKDGQ